ncbi:helix-turn-helix domain-containing protein [Streptosporangium sp. NBC_01756]|uniref:helix-turn-helix domain-containing protein n=1 Tax=Streptosporangium sp. NBC_01756 TaxID=2975950 RepID=UPI002DDA24E5|nr:helix-turn-helix domain-containing protein [Streptosporangium sp. NBC_01756]WSC85532.1 helix-turn-helix domain-containing protein [Streptosporangium sp. NBC_01756]
MDPVEQLLHPVRLRIVHALSAAGALTIAQMCARLPEVPKITVYRQVAQLTEGGFVEVDGEQRVRGAIERRYRLRQNRPTIDTDAAAAMSLDDHRRGFAAAMAVLIAEFNAYLDRDGANPAADSVSYRQGTLWLSPDELTAMTADLLTVLRDRLANTPAPDRTPYLLSAILFPTEQPPPHGTGR